MVFAIFSSILCLCWCWSLIHHNMKHTKETNKIRRKFVSWKVCILLHLICFFSSFFLLSFFLALKTTMDEMEEKLFFFSLSENSHFLLFSFAYLQFLKEKIFSARIIKEAIFVWVFSFERKEFFLFNCLDFFFKFFKTKVFLIFNKIKLNYSRYFSCRK